MRFDYDPQKSRKNLEQHGIDFEEVQELWEGNHVIIPAKNVLGENRSAVLGKIKGRIHMAIFTERDDAIRIISCHRVDKKWERLFHEYFKKEKS